MDERLRLCLRLSGQMSDRVMSREQTSRRGLSMFVLRPEEDFGQDSWSTVVDNS